MTLERKTCRHCDQLCPAMDPACWACGGQSFAGEPDPPPVAVPAATPPMAAAAPPARTPAPAEPALPPVPSTAQLQVATLSTSSDEPQLALSNRAGILLEVRFASLIGRRGPDAGAFTL